MNEWTLLSAATVGALAISALQPTIARLPHAPAERSDLGLKSDNRPNPEFRRAVTAGYRVALSDYDWLNAIQYYGTPANASENYSRLFGMLDEATDLDPRFDYAYQFAGQSVPYQSPIDNAWHNTKQAITLLEKGVRAGTKRWQVPWLLGFIRYTYWGDYAQAGEDINQAAFIADRPKTGEEMLPPPKYLHSLATRLLAQGGAIDTAIETTQLALAEAVDPDRRAELQSRLNSLLLKQQLDELQAAQQRLEDHGIQTPNIDQIEAEAGFSPPVLDPFGGTFHVNNVTHQIRSDNQDKLLRLFIHPGSPAIERAVD